MENVNTNTNPITNLSDDSIKIKLPTPLPFNPVGEINFTTTKKLSTLINDIFAQTFEDYYGASLKVQFQPDLRSYIVVPSLFFRVLKNYDSNKRYAFRTLGSANRNDGILNRVNRVSQSIATGAQVEITNAGKTGMYDFMFPSVVKSSNFDWRSAFRTVPGDSESFVQVFKLDILKFITLLFGETGVNGSKQYYQIMPITTVGTPTQYKAPDEWSLEIMRLDHENESYACELLGYNAPSQTSMPSVVTELSGK